MEKISHEPSSVEPSDSVSALRVASGVHSDCFAVLAWAIMDWTTRKQGVSIRKSSVWRSKRSFSITDPVQTAKCNLSMQQN